MCRRLFTVGTDPGDLCFQKLDARIQLFPRVAVQDLPSEGIGGVSARSGAIVVFHQRRASDAVRLLSTGPKARTGDACY